MPSRFVSVVVETPLFTFVKTTTTPAIAPPEESVTSPVTVALESAKAGRLHKNKPRRTSKKSVQTRESYPKGLLVGLLEMYARRRFMVDASHSARIRHRTAFRDGSAGHPDSRRATCGRSARDCR